MEKSTYLLTLLLLPFLFTNCASTAKLKQAETNRETIRLWYEEGWNHNRNLELIEQVFHPEWTDGNPLRPGQTIGHEGMEDVPALVPQAAQGKARQLGHGCSHRPAAPPEIAARDMDWNTGHYRTGSAGSSI